MQVGAVQEIAAARQRMDLGGEERSGVGRNSCVIRRVPASITVGNEDSFRPLALAVGPYYYGNENLMQMEGCKTELLEKSPQLKKFEIEVRALIFEMRCFYPPDVIARCQIDFVEMIYRDAFFVVFVLFLCEKQVFVGLDSTNWFGITNFDSSMLKVCARDMLIADNQLPWPIVDKVSSLIFGGEKNGRFMINIFLSSVMCKNLSSKVPDDLFDGNPLHLLDVLRRRYLENYQYPEDDSFVLYSAKELLMKGLKIVEAVPKKGTGFVVGGVSFCWRNATLELPRLSICEHFKHIFLNMAGYEATRGLFNGGEITKFLCLFRALLRDLESVAIMRKRFIFCKEDDEMILDMFIKMCQNLHPDFLIYEVAEVDRMSQFGFLDKVKLQSRGLYQTYITIPLALGVGAAINRAMIWGAELFEIYVNSAILPVAAMVLGFQNMLSNHSSTLLESYLRCFSKLNLLKLMGASGREERESSTLWNANEAPKQEGQRSKHKPSSWRKALQIL